MLKKLKIIGFKSIVDQTLEFGRVNLFIGANGAGKSNVLEAIGILSASLGRDITDTELQKKGVRLSVPTLSKSSFKNVRLRTNFSFEAEFNQDTQYDVRITASEKSATLRFFSEHIKYRNKKYLGRSNHGISIEGVEDTQRDLATERGIWDRYGEISDVPPEMAAELNKLAKFCIYAPQTSFLRGSDIESTPVKPIGLLGGGLPQAASTVLQILNSPEAKKDGRHDLMREIIDLVWMPGWANQFQVAPAYPTWVSSQVLTGEHTLFFRDRYMKRGRDRLSAYDSSEGSLYLLFLAIVSLHPEAPKIVAFDNIDNALNPRVTRSLLEKLIKITHSDKFQHTGIGPEQIFLTSHNPTALDAFDIFDEDQRIFIVKRRPGTGDTVVEQLKPKTGMTKSDWIQIKKGKRLSELWIEGLIDGSLGNAEEMDL